MSKPKYPMVFQKPGIWLYRGYLLRRRGENGKWRVTHLNGAPVPDMVDFKTRDIAAKVLSMKLATEGII